MILCCGNVAGRGSGRHKDGEAGRLREGAGLQYEDREMWVRLALVLGTLGLALGVMEVLELQMQVQVAVGVKVDGHEGKARGLAPS